MEKNKDIMIDDDEMPFDDLDTEVEERHVSRSRRKSRIRSPACKS